MFTGIIEATGNISELQNKGGDLKVSIYTTSLDFSDVKLGDSIATNGVCLTVVSLQKNGFSADVSQETLALTGFSNYKLGQKVNLEKALTLADRLGGHLVSGHVDGLGTVILFEPIGESWELVIEAPASLAKYLAYKGSIVVNGVSLTVNRVSDNETGCAVSINLIPHTIAATTLKHLKSGSQVNLEIDLIARYVERMLSVSSLQASMPN